MSGSAPPAWARHIIDVHLAVTDAVSHAQRLASERYFVWQEEGASDFAADGRHAERTVRGTTDLFTKAEFDPWKDAFEGALDAAPCVLAWGQESVQYEEDTGLWHYEWTWAVI